MNRIGHAVLKAVATLWRDRLLAGLIALAFVAGAGLVVAGKLKMVYVKDGLKVCLVCSDTDLSRSAH